MIQRDLSKMAPEEVNVFRKWLEILNAKGVAYVLGGAYALYLHTGIFRETKDLDVFIEPKDLKTALDAFSAAGYETKIHSPHWLAKVFHGPYFLDLLFGFWNGRLRSIQNWCARSKTAPFAGVPVPLISAEDLIVSKAYVAGRDRFDGADIVHVILKAEGKVDWTQVLIQLGDDYALLLWHLILFDYVYPGHSEGIRECMTHLFKKVRDSNSKALPSFHFRGPLLDPFSFNIDMEEMDYVDPRDMTPVVDEEGNLL